MNNTICSGSDCAFNSNRTAQHLLHHIVEKIPTKINYSEIDILPKRENFINQATRSAFKKQVDAAKPVIFMPTTVVEKNDWRDDRLKYLIYLFGVLPCGSKTCVILSDIEVHVDIMVPDNMSADDFENVLRGQLVEKNLVFTCINTIMAFRLHNFQKQKRPYKRIVFDTLQERKKVIDFISKHNKDLKSAGKPKLETAADDLSRDNYYFPKVAREYKFATADWNRIEKYKVLSPALTTNCTYVLEVDVRDFKKVSKSRREEYLAPGHFLAPVIDRDPTMVGMWDIETHRTIQNGLVPTPNDIDFTIFMICSAYFQHYSEEPLAEFCVVDQESNARKGISLVIVCGNEVNVVTAHMEIIGRMCPDIMGAFNGGNFDWPLYREKCRRFKLLTKLKSKFSSLPPYKSGRYTDTEESVEKWCFTFKNIKIDAETTHKLSCVATFPGILDTDVLPVFLKMYPRAEVRKSASLNFFLAKNGLESKEDMPYKRMFKIYERACKLVQMKSCHCGDAQSHCATCGEIIKELDCKPRPGSKNMESTEYSDELHDDLMNELGRQLCCWCGKRPRSQRDMADVGYYCVIDCVRPQQLYVKRTIIPDKRELSTMSYVSLADSFYRADGMKVCNVIGAYCFKYGIAFSNAASDKEAHDKDHFPGGWVFPPRRGLHSDNFIEVDVVDSNGVARKKQIRARPITGLDFASLYPSLMMAYNLSPDMIVNTRAEADALLSEGYSLHHIQPFNYERGAKKGNVGNKHCTIEGWTVRHNGVFNPKTDKNIAAKYVKYEKIEYVIDGQLQSIKYPAHVGCDATQAETLASLRDAGVKTTRRVTYEPEVGRPALVGERMGIFSFIVKKIFDKRVPIKAEFVRLTKLKEEMEHKGLSQITITTKGVDRILSFEDVSFMLNKVESKQKALKILANTFYGKSGDYRASIYSLLVAAGITCAGQENIKRVAQFVSSLGFISQYGDSVTGDTPILCKFADDIIGYRVISELVNDTREWQSYGDKEAAEPQNISVWTERGWTPIRRVIRHYTNKPIYRVLTNTGCVDVTADHSLLNERAEKIRPVDVQVGTRLLHADLPSEKSFADDGLAGLRFRARSKIEAANLYYSFEKIGCKMTISYSNSMPDNYKLTLTSERKDDHSAVKKIQCLGSTPQYVYDLETENHHFGAGIGRMIVHNTDSLYLSCPDDVFAECDREYNDKMSALRAEFEDVDAAAEPDPKDSRAVEYKARRTALRVVWWEKQVKITMNLMNNLKEKVSDFLLANNGTLFLNMAYEEVGYPTVLCGKKKYYLTPHVATINFYPKDYFIRGIDIIKQGQAPISRQLGDEYIKKSLSPENERELIDLAGAQIRKFYSMEIKPTSFVLSAKYRPDKKNIPVLSFVKRMKEMRELNKANPLMAALYEPPEPGDKFEYVIVKKHQTYTLQGNKIEIKKGDQMEYLRVYLASQSTTNPMEIDLDYYMKNAVVGVFARFIAYHPQFQPPEGMFDITNKDQYRELDQYCIAGATKYLESICDSITGYDRAAINKVGRDYRAIYHRADKQIRRDLATRYGGASMVLHDINLHVETGEGNRVVDQLKELARGWADVGGENVFGVQYIHFNNQHRHIQLFALRRIYNGTKGPSVTKIRIQICDRKEKQLEESLFRLVNRLTSIVYQYERGVINLIEDMRKVKFEDDVVIEDNELEYINAFNADDAKVILDTYDIIRQLGSVYRLREDTLSIAQAIENECAGVTKITISPQVDAAAIARHESARAPTISEYIWQ